MPTHTNTPTWDQAAARRMERSHLTAPAPTGTAPCAVARGLCGTHAQVMSAAELSTALRLDGATRQDVRAAVAGQGMPGQNRTLVKTFGPRGTVHLLPLADLDVWCGALAAVPGTALMPAAVRMTDGQTDEVVAAVADALQSAELTGDELSDAVVERTGSWAADPVMPAFAGMWPRWRQALHTAGHRGALCFGADRGRKVTYTNPARFRPGFTPLTPGEALPRAVAHYLHAYGPATPQHFAQWLSTRPRWTADLFGRLAADGAIEQVEFGGVTAWVNAGDTAFPDSPPQGVVLLPYFDAYAVACQPRDLLFPGRAFERALGGGQAGNFPVLLIDGVVAGVWHQRRSGRNIDVTVEALHGLTAAQRLEVEVRAERVAEVLEGRLRLTVGPVSVGAHA